MSNYNLKAEVSRLESRLRKIEHENSQLQDEIAIIVRNVNEADNVLTEYNQRVGNMLENARGTINKSIDQALGSYELQGQIDQLYTRFKYVELANKKIRTLNNKKYYEFNNYRTVRKIVTGLMDNLDLNLVSDGVIYKSIERQHLQTPDFWLTPVLISIMAWKNDDRPLADRAMETAYKLDKKNSSIFYMIFNMRMGRDQAAIKWFLEYQKCSLKGSDDDTFLMMVSLISKTLSDNVDEETSGLISDYIHRIVVECAEKEGYSETDVVGFIRDKMRILVRTSSYDLPALAKYCKDYNTITSMLNLAANNYNILEFILWVVNVPVEERNTYLKEYLNDLLASPNDVEVDTYNEIEYNELIIRLRGDVDKAREIFDKEILRRKSDFNIISSMVKWIYDFGNDDISGQMRLNMFTLVKSLQEKAARSYFADYRAMYKEVHPVEILDYATDVDFAQKAGEIGKAEEFYQGQQTRELAKVKNIWAFVAIGIGIACGVTAPFVHLLFFAGLGIGGAVGAGILISNRYRRRNIILRIQKQKENVLEILRKLFADFEKMRMLYKEYDGISEKILEEYAKL